jgi:hypothetical protein
VVGLMVSWPGTRSSSGASTWAKWVALGFGACHSVFPLVRLLAMADPSGPLDDVLGRWLDKDVIRGRVPFDPSAVVQPLQPGRQADLVLELSDVLETAHVPLKRPGWQLSPASDGEILAYVPAGAGLERRITNGGLYADRVLVEPPEILDFRVGLMRFSLPHMLREYRAEEAALKSSRTAQTVVESAHVDALPDEIYEYFDEIFDEIEADRDRMRPAVFAQVPDVAETLLNYAWTVKKPLAQNWLSIVDRGYLLTDNIKEIHRDPEVRVELERWRSANPEESNEAFHQLFTGAGLADYAHAPYVVTLPPTRAVRDLIELAYRYYFDIPYGGVLIDMGYPPPRRAVTDAGIELRRGSWFDELLVGLGPVTQHLDTDAVCELRANGVQQELKMWLQEDLNRLAFAAGQGGDTDRVTAEITRRLNGIADRAVNAVRESRSATFRARLTAAGIWGASGLVVGFVGTVLTGGSLAIAAAAAGVGFALSGGAAAASTKGPRPTRPSPVLLDVLSATRARQRKKV